MIHIETKHSKTMGASAALCLVLLLAACGGPRYGKAPVTPQPMVCSGDVPAQITLFSPAEAKLNFEDKAYTLERMEVSSGVKYGNDDITIWKNGISAMITKDDGTVSTCTYVPKSGL